MERLFEMDGQLLLWIREVFASPVMDKIMIFISSLANKGMLWIGIGVVLLLLGVKGRKWSNRGLLVLLSLAFNMVICNLLLKPLVARTRPYDLLGYEILVRRLGDYSFPSGHTSASFAAATAIYAIDRRWGAAAYVLAALIGFSRLYLGVHFRRTFWQGRLSGFWRRRRRSVFWRKKCISINKISYFLNLNWLSFDKRLKILQKNGKNIANRLILR